MLSSVHHIAVIVSDYDRAKNFYTEVLGMRIVRENYRRERDSYKLDLAISDDTATQIDLLSFPHAPPRVSRPEACGARHLCFTVANLESALKRLRERHEQRDRGSATLDS
jgi:glyoxylase I family protein